VFSPIHLSTVLVVTRQRWRGRTSGGAIRGVEGRSVDPRGRGRNRTHAVRYASMVG
jgi:hypothetical protein